MINNETVVMTKSTVDLLTNEILQIHALCDRVRVPRKINGELMSFGQRVAIMEQVCVRLMEQASGVPMYTVQ